MTTILQNFYGEFQSLKAISEPIHSAYARRFGYTLVCGDIPPPNDLIGGWSKIVAIIKWLRQLPVGDLLIWIDGDALIIKDEPLELPDDCDLGLCRIKAVNGTWYNSGVMFVRNSERTLKFFEAVLYAGPFKKQSDGYLGSPYLGDQGRINSLLEDSDLKVLDLDARYNAYLCNPHDDPVILCWHGLPTEHVGILMQRAVDARVRRRAA